ncbi:MAG: UvrB/UvrC motif-containing protein [Verrucomicrobiae bacterium]|nr:UvrB/UvrC motif-containing protein [Verrucomicrobiae bacterium]
MKCDICKETEAKVHLTQVINGVMQKVDLCESCAKAKGLADPTAFSLADLLLDTPHAGGQTKGMAPAETRCANCGMTQTDFKKTGRLGCSRCYETFAEALAPLLKGMHKGVQHVGKQLPGASLRLAAADEIKTLRRDLEKAVKEENYEFAAEIRNKIRRLETSGEARE